MLARQTTAFLYDERCFWHVPAGVFVGPAPVGGWVQPSPAGGFPESPETKRRLRNLVDVSGLLASLVVRSAAPATDGEMLAVHPASYLANFKALSDAGGGPFGELSPVGPGSYEIARLSAGLAIEAVRMVMQGDVSRAYALCRPPGHHCMPGEAKGFCYLANESIAILSALERFQLKRVAVVDWDVHHGNGTQAVFYRRADVLTISVHQDGCFPPGYGGLADRGDGDGLGYNINIPLPAGSGEATYLRAFDNIVVPALEQFEPELIVVACGFDANAFDPLARMQLSSACYRRLTQRVCRVADRYCSGRIAFIHEGGYAEFYVPFCGLAVLEEMSGISTKVGDPEVSFIAAQQPSGAFRAFLDRYVDECASVLRSSPMAGS